MYQRIESRKSDKKLCAFTPLRHKKFSNFYHRSMRTNTSYYYFRHNTSSSEKKDKKSKTGVAQCINEDVYSNMKYESAQGLFVTLVCSFYVADFYFISCLGATKGVIFTSWLESHSCYVLGIIIPFFGLEKSTFTALNNNVLRGLII